eukprot:m.73213 g.73213  ORF g.73213 m.73213 type:complete len:593 (-) comp12361_c0_seq4:674-2452(-)
MKKSGKRTSSSSTPLSSKQDALHQIFQRHLQQQPKVAKRSSHTKASGARHEDAFTAGTLDDAAATATAAAPASAVDILEATPSLAEPTKAVPMFLAPGSKGFVPILARSVSARQSSVSGLAEVTNVPLTRSRSARTVSTTRVTSSDVTVHGEGLVTSSPAAHQRARTKRSASVHTAQPSALGLRRYNSSSAVYRVSSTEPLRQESGADAALSPSVAAAVTASIEAPTEDLDTYIDAPPSHFTHANQSWIEPERVPAALELSDKHKQPNHTNENYGWNDSEGFMLLLRRQRRSIVRASYLEDLGCKINKLQRAIILSWLMDVCDDYKLQRSTFHSAVYLFDGFLSVQPCPERHRLQLLGCTCLFLAAKFEEIYYPSIDELAELTAGACTAQQMRDMELEVCKAVGWCFSGSTSLGWLDFYLKMMVRAKAIGSVQHGFCDFDQQLYLRATQVLELCVLDTVSLRFAPSMIAAAALTLCLDIKHAVDPHLISGYRLPTLVLCMQWLRPYVQQVAAHSASWRKQQTQQDSNLLVRCISFSLFKDNQAAAYHAYMQASSLSDAESTPAKDPAAAVSAAARQRLRFSQASAAQSASSV